MPEPEYLEKSADFDSTRKYRYTLYREWGSPPKGSKPALFIMLNPSTADENVLDPTVRRCLGYAMDWGYQKMLIGNIFALRSTDPRELYKSRDPVGEDNDLHLVSMALNAGIVILAFGNHGIYKDRGNEVIRMLRSKGVPLYYLQKTKAGQPAHPLYLRADLRPKLVEEKEWNIFWH